jgi:CDP-diacylglycerol--glycerol-3-phosphate 3-phosphatidyltransferase/cardiolipin synthase
LVSAIIATRFAAALLFLWSFTSGRQAGALCAWLIAVSSDALDGHVARRLGGVCPWWGPYSDAVADFCFVLAAFSAFVLEGLYPFWLLILIIAMFAQFLLTSSLSRPVYDPVGKYYGLFLFCAIGVTLVLPSAGVRRAVLALIAGFTFAAVTSRAVFLFGLWKQRVPGPGEPAGLEPL